MDLLAQLIPGEIEGPELRAPPLTRSWERHDLVPTQSEGHQSLIKGGGRDCYSIQSTIHSNSSITIQINVEKNTYMTSRFNLFM